MIGIFQPLDRKTQTTSVSDTATLKTFAVGESVFKFKNAGTKTAFIRFGATATTADYPLLAGETEFITVPTTTISLICTATETTTVYISPGSVV